MGLNKQTGNMYDFVTHTWNTIKGKCPHNCSYCYVKRWCKQSELHFDEKELKTDLGQGNFIFVGSSCDMFADDIEPGWVIDTLIHCKKYDNNIYLFQTKNPKNFDSLGCHIANLNNFILCTTIETNRCYPKIMCNSPTPARRAIDFSKIPDPVKKQITCEPLMDFDLDDLIRMIKKCNPYQVNIGSDSGRNGLPEPSKEQVLELISELEKFTIVVKKKNLSRLLK
jgi:hypothetical protein